MIERGSETRGATGERAVERVKAVDAAILAIEKQFGRQDGGVNRLGALGRTVSVAGPGVGPSLDHRHLAPRS